MNSSICSLHSCYCPWAWQALFTGKGGEDTLGLVYDGENWTAFRVVQLILMYCMLIVTMLSGTSVWWECHLATILGGYAWWILLLLWQGLWHLVTASGASDGGGLESLKDSDFPALGETVRQPTSTPSGGCRPRTGMGSVTAGLSGEFLNYFSDVHLPSFVLLYFCSIVPHFFVNEATFSSNFCIGSYLFVQNMF